MLISDWSSDVCSSGLKVVSSSTVQGRGRGRARTELRVSDGSGYLRVTFFNQPWRARQLPQGSEAMFFGKVTEYRGQKQLANPEIDLLEIGRAQCREGEDQNV